MRFRLDVPAGFSFRRTVLSHGWCMLAPFVLGPKASRLETVVALPGGGARRLRLEPEEDGVLLSVPGRISSAERLVLGASARRILNLDLDLGPFHAAVRRFPGLEWIAETGSGRMLRCPTVFEDAVKLILTTNCSWGFTTRMASALVDRWGETSTDGSHAFPSARALASAGAGEIRRRARAGYRARYLADFARKVARGEVDPEAWERDALDPAALRRELLALPGVGPYVAENLLKLLGRPRGLALDSWMRSKYATLRGRGRPVADSAIARRYRALGDFAGLALWLTLTRDWFEGDEPSAAWESLS